MRKRSITTSMIVLVLCVLLVGVIISIRATYGLLLMTIDNTLCDLSSYYTALGTMLFAMVALLSSMVAIIDYYMKREQIDDNNIREDFKAILSIQGELIRFLELKSELVKCDQYTESELLKRQVDESIGILLLFRKQNLYKKCLRLLKEGNSDEG